MRRDAFPSSCVARWRTHSLARKIEGWAPFPAESVYICALAMNAYAARSYPPKLPLVRVCLVLVCACMGSPGEPQPASQQSLPKVSDSLSTDSTKVEDEKADATTGTTNSPTTSLPSEPSPEIKFDAPFDGAAIATHVTAGGVRVEDFVIGTGPLGQPNGEVEVHYTGRLTDGTVFDSSIPRKKPIVFRLATGRVIKGWHEGVEGMRVGGKRKLVIPPSMGYGERGKGKIPANATLVFTLELVSARPPLPPPKPAEAFSGTSKRKKTLAGGILLEDFAAGKGDAAETGDTVTVHYIGTLSDGTQFDSSHKRDAMSFTLGQGRVIKGWDQGIVGMKVGGLRKLVIPPELAYGQRSMGKIPANATLAFTVELMDVRKATAPQ